MRSVIDIQACARCIHVHMRIYLFLYRSIHLYPHDAFSFVWKKGINEPWTPKMKVQIHLCYQEEGAAILSMNAFAGSSSSSF